MLTIIPLQIQSFSSSSLPIMRTVGQTSNNRWTCENPTEFEEAMIRVHSSLSKSPKNTWDAISVKRNNEELGNLYLFRQCLQLWESEMEKWGCNGLGEKLGDRLLVSADMPCSVTKAHEIQMSYDPNIPPQR